jgi:hypothetical protein
LHFFFIIFSFYIKCSDISFCILFFHINYFDVFLPFFLRHFFLLYKLLGHILTLFFIYIFSFCESNNIQYCSHLTFHLLVQTITLKNNEVYA